MATQVRTKIVATLGPACCDVEGLCRMVEAGVNVLRLNFSHGAVEDHAARLEAVREASRRTKRPLAVLGDLCGPKIRLGEVKPGVVLAVGDTLAMQREPVLGDAARVSIAMPRVIDQVRPGERVLIDDGAVQLTVVDRNDAGLVLRVTTGGPISSHKGVNLPDTSLDLGGMTERDRQFAAWAVQNELEYVGMSFVRNAADLRELRGVLGEAGREIGIIAKIERREALDHLDEIIAASDGVMVARGDLGVEVDPALVPGIQKDIIRRCRAAARPVIVATQMLQSMIASPAPTRAEVSDVANAVYDGADAVMLSGETAVGAYPVVAVEAMNHVAHVAEQDMERWGVRAQQPLPAVQQASVAEQDAALADGAARMAERLPIRLVVAWSETGLTARMFSKLRLDPPVIALSSDPRAVRRMALYWGVVPAMLEVPHSITELTPRVERLLLDQGWANPDDLVLIVSGTRLSERGTSNAVVVHRLGRFLD